MKKNIILSVLLMLSPFVQAEQEANHFTKFQETARICGADFKFKIPDNYVLASEHKDDTSATYIFTPVGRETKERFTSSITLKQLYVDKSANERLNDVEKQLVNAAPAIKTVKRSSKKLKGNNGKYQKSSATYTLKNNEYNIATNVICYADDDSIIEVQACVKNRESKKAMRLLKILLNQHFQFK
ncbi:hypothetical protein MMH89_00845 [Candidatus Comchoanobacter bicostacola]|uniref:Uncharacterized protein n=1 Tax=Candidatus Comchoanobacter bicostacola TaxID=2919598 RepID=A0ABY5DKB9_9GAMM|nr:hypothetical protein [Candidatus Comchoanobacter bicostacola]UTC24711.1 hypothetical protein MMH89_00845 [Candidatus Comchoanobacter bicostacola]